jgi:hypothetical protein
MGSGIDICYRFEVKAVSISSGEFHVVLRIKNNNYAEHLLVKLT